MPSAVFAGFVRGDSNGDVTVDIGDPILSLSYLFSGAALPCLDAADSNDDGVVDIGDPIHSLGYLFSQGAEPPPPFPACGTDPTQDALDCATPPIDCPDLPPVIDSSAPPIAVEGQLYEYAVIASDPLNETLTYSLTAAPSGATIDAQLGVLVWTPSAVQSGLSHSFELVVENTSGASASQAFSVFVQDVNQPPVIVSNPPTTATEGAPYSYAAAAIDPDPQDVLFFDLPVAPAGAAIQAATGLLSWLPSAAQGGQSHPVTIHVSDLEGAEATQSFTVDVAQIDQLIEITSVPPTSATIGASFVYQVIADDPDGSDPIAFSLTISPPGGNAAIDATGRLTWTPTQPGPQSFEVQAQRASAAVFQAFTVQVFDLAAIPPDPTLVAPASDPARPTRLLDYSAFLYEGPDQIQRGVSPGTIEPEFVSVVLGTIRASDGSPLSGVLVTISSHPEYGSTVSRADGGYTLVANGGAELVLCYRRPGYAEAQRRAKCDWEKFTLIEDVFLITLDTAVTAVAFTASTTDFQSARGTVQTDFLGARQPTVVVPPGTEATLHFPDGSTQASTSLALRLTEYTLGANGPQAMPAPLPPGITYTHCVEISADEATASGAATVMFDTPLVYYVESQLGAPVGSPIPLGVYDRQTAAWEDQGYGTVIEIVAELGGVAEIDITGDGVADSAAALAALGITDGERAELASLYDPAIQLYRAEIAHLSPWDLNYRVYLPDDTSGPGDWPPGYRMNDCETCPCLQGGNSEIEVQNQVLRESIPIAGSGLTLNYNSATSLGSRAFRTIEATLIGPAIPIGVAQITVRGEACGVELPGGATYLPADYQPNLSHLFVWDGSQDCPLGAWHGDLTATVTVTYYYFLARTPSEGWSTAVDVNIAQVYSVDPILIPVSRVFSRKVGTVDARSVGLGGWTLSTHHSMHDGERKYLLRGDGGRQFVPEIASVVETVKTGNLNLEWVPSLAVGRSGDFYAIVWGPNCNQAIVRIPADGVSSANGYDIVAGTLGNFCTPTPGTDGNPAVGADLGRLRDVCLDGEDRVCFTTYNNVETTLRRVEHDGTLRTLIGNVAGSPNFYNGMLAEDLAVSSGSTVVNGWLAIRSPALGPEGRIYFILQGINSIYDEHAIIFLDKEERLWHVAGTLPGSSPVPTSCNSAALYQDGDSAFDVTLEIADFFVNPSGEVIISHRCPSQGPQIITKVSVDGFVTRVAGQFGQFGYSGDGGPSTDALTDDFPLDGSSDNLPFYDTLASDGVGGFFFSEAVHWVIRHVDGSGTITTVSGVPSIVYQYQATFYGTGGYTREPRCLEAANDGSLVFMENSPNSSPGTNPLPPRLRRWKRERPAIPVQSGLLPGEELIPSKDGSEIYRFRDGLHSETLDALTGTVLLTFNYTTGLPLPGQQAASEVLDSIVDAQGNTLQIVRDASGAPLQIVSPQGVVTNLGLNGDGYLSSVSDAMGNTWALTYQDDEGLLVGYRDPDLNLTTFQYDAGGLLVGEQNMAHAAAGPTVGPSLLREKEQDGHGVTFTTAEGVSTKQEWERLPTGEELTTYTNLSAACGCTMTVLTKRDGTEETTYADGTVVFLKRIPDPIWGTLVPRIEQIVSTTPGGIVSTVNVTRTVTPAPENLTDPFSFDTIVEQVTVNGRTFTNTYDRNARTWTVETPEQRTWTRTYDLLGRLVLVEPPGGIAPTSFDYDVDGFLTTITQQGSLEPRIFDLNYTAQGFLSQTIGPDGRVNSFTNDAIGRVVEHMLPDGNSVGYSYDDASNVDGVTPPGRPEHEFAYNTVNLVSAYSPPGPEPITTGYQYDLDKRVSEVAEPGPLPEIDFAYDDAGRLSSVTGPTQSASYGYHPTTGQLTSIATSEGETLSFTHDGPLVTSTTWSGTVNGSVQWTYDANHRPISMTVTGSSGAFPVVTYGYDDDGLLTSAGGLTIDRDQANGRIIGTSIGGGVVTDSYTYDEFGDVATYVASANGSSIFQVSYTRDIIGRIIGLDETVTVGGVPTSKSYDYYYDSRGRLIRVDLDGAIQSEYAYDANGNRLPGGPVGCIPQYSDDDRLLCDEGANYTYDASGRLIAREDLASGEISNYGYDEFGVLSSFGKELGGLPVGAQVEYILDGLGRRIGRLVDGALVQGFLYQDLLRPAAELDGSGAIVNLFVYGPRTNVPATIMTAGGTLRIISDHLGTPRLVVSSVDGSVSQATEYDPFGQAVQSTGVVTHPFGFTGGILDAASDLVRIGARDYNPIVGAWHQKDPLGQLGSGSSRYSYCQSDPINRIDITGLDDIFVGLSGTYAVIGGLTVTVGNVLDTDEGTVGSFVSIGLVGGLDISGGAVGGWMDGDIEGLGAVGSVSVGEGVSGSLAGIVGDDGSSGFQAGLELGPLPGGVSAGRTMTWSIPCWNLGSCLQWISTEMSKAKPCP